MTTVFGRAKNFSSFQRAFFRREILWLFWMKIRVIYTKILSLGKDRPNIAQIHSLSLIPSDVKARLVLCFADVLCD